MTYVKPKIVVHGAREMAEWAVPQKDVVSDESNAVDFSCHCAMSGSKM